MPEASASVSDVTLLVPPLWHSILLAPLHCLVEIAAAPSQSASAPPGLWMVRMYEFLDAPCSLQQELLRKLRGAERSKSLGVISDYMRANTDAYFDLSDWPFPFLKVRSFETLRWLVGRIVRPDTCTNYVNPDMLVSLPNTCKSCLFTGKHEVSTLIAVRGH